MEYQYGTMLKEVEVPPFHLTLRSDRETEFYEHIMRNRQITSKQDFSQGFSGMAAMGLSTLFTHIPNKFVPVLEIVRFLRDEQSRWQTLHYNSIPETPVSLEEVVLALEEFARTRTQLRGDGSEIV